jgi:Family of unknown function (DUF6077)
LEGLPAGIARVCDGFLDFVVLAFAAWTVVYHVCLVLRIDAVWAAIAGAVALIGCGLFVARSRLGPVAADPVEAPSAPGRRLPALAAAHVAAGLGAAALFAYTAASWWIVLCLWTLAAASAVALTSLRPARDAAAGSPPVGYPPHDLPGAAIALAWAAGLAILSLFTIRSAEDDTHYVRLATWIAEHGQFPLRDTLFSDEVYSAIFYPPVSSFEAAVGTLAHTTGLAVPDLVYLAVAPLVAALGVLALWRLYRAWQVPLVWVALSVALVFLLFDAGTYRALGQTVLSRTWHGKAALLAVLVPVLFVLLQEYRERPTRQRLVLLAAAGAAAVGLSTTALFLVPLVAAACLAPAAIRSPGQTAAGFLATTAYPLGAGLVAFAVGQETAGADFYVRPGVLVEYVLPAGLLAFVLIAPVLIPRRIPAQMAAATVLLVGLLLAPPVTEAAFDLTGLTRVWWRLLWAIPVAALVGVVAVGLSAPARSRVLRVLPAILLCAVFVVWGTAVWSSPGVVVASTPSWKRPPHSVTAARQILSQADTGAVVLAPKPISQTLAIMSADVFPVAPRLFYARALEGPAAHAEERVVLQTFAETGLEKPIPRMGRRPEAEEVIRGLGLVGVDIACVVDNPESQRILLAARYSPIESPGALICMRAPEDGGEG